jgi:hypothetical protein
MHEHQVVGLDPLGVLTGDSTIVLLGRNAPRSEAEPRFAGVTRDLKIDSAGRLCQREELGMISRRLLRHDDDKFAGSARCDPTTHDAFEVLRMMAAGAQIEEDDSGRDDRSLGRGQAAVVKNESD